MQPVIELQNVSYAVRGKRIVNDASWKVLPGEHWGILGPNGAGKTTLLRMACGYLWPNDGGRILRQGEESIDLRELRRSIGWVSSTLAGQIPRDEPVLDTVVSGHFAQTGLMRMEWDPPLPEHYELAREQLRIMHCDGLVDRQFGVLSQGEQQRVLIARAKMAQPLLVVLDEPCVGLDPGGREQFLASLNRMAEAPQSESIPPPSMIMVTHRLEEIMPAFDKILAMSDARIVGSGPKSEVATAELLAQLYGQAPAEMIERNGRVWPIW